MGRASDRPPRTRSQGPHRKESGLGLFSFGKKKPAESADAPAGAFVPQPDKAEKFFAHAKTASQTGNHEYALMLYAKGFRFDPNGLPRH